MAVTRHLFRGTSVALIVAFTCLPSLSAPTVIAELGSAPLLGPNATLAELQVSIARNEDRLTKAARLAGMSAREIRAFRVATQTQRPDWVRVPRRLTAMTFYSGGEVRVIHDVEIPAATYGFEYDQSGPAERLRIYIPVACGNLSILRERIRRAAVRKTPMQVSAIPPHVTVPASPAPMSAAAPAPSPQAVPTSTPTALPTIYLGSQQGHGFFPFLAALFGFVAAGGGNHNGGGGTGGGGGGGGGCGCTRNPH